MPTSYAFQQEKSFAFVANCAGNCANYRVLAKSRFGLGQSMENVLHYAGLILSS